MTEHAKANIFSFLFLWVYIHLLDLGRVFSFSIIYKVGRTPWTGDQPVAKGGYLYLQNTISSYENMDLEIRIYDINKISRKSRINFCQCVHMMLN
jgi:hypothetical protein